MGAKAREVMKDNYGRGRMAMETALIMVPGKTKSM